MNTACYLVNRSPATAINCKTPFEVWFGKPADYSNLRIFGYPAYYHVSEGKLEPRAKKDLFMGYGSGVKGYRIWSPSESKVILSRSITFNEKSLLHLGIESVVSETGDGVSKQVEFDVAPAGTHQHGSSETDQQNYEPQSEVEAEQPPVDTHSIATDRSRRQIKPPIRYGFEDMVAYALQATEEIEAPEPSNFREAISSKLGCCNG